MLKYALFIGTLVTAVLQCDNKSESMNDHEGRDPNHLINESSPYLLQHAYNPVDWYPWGEAALKKAGDENKMLLISIGYSACHWCHVMEKESFEDSLVAETMNASFVSIKVDREERPDIDDIYMTACQLAGQGSCGWPLNAFALPDGRPVWAGTYFPKKNWLQILEYFNKLQKEEPEKLEQYADQLTAGIRENERQLVVSGDKEQSFSENQANELAETYLKQVDKQYGGRKGAPKFPMPVNQEFLLRYGVMNEDEEAKNAVLLTLDKMAAGGIYDQIGGGFARYSTDGRWHVPHFEKMLYDNAQLLSLYSHGYQVTGDSNYLDVIDGTITFLDRELSNGSGGYYSALDADSEGEEGKFYVWTLDEIITVLGNTQQAEIFNERFDVKSNGNWEDGKNVLQVHKDIPELAGSYGLDNNEVENQLDDAKEKLLEARESRVRPGLDDKMLCSWNGLLLTGLANAYKATGNEAYLEKAKASGQFIKKAYLQEDHRLLRNHKDGKSSINGFLDDYVFVIEGFQSLYEITFDESWLYEAKALTEYCLEHFHDDSTGFFFYTSDIDPPLITRKKELSDNVIPASNSAMARNLHVLGHYFYEEKYLDISQRMLQQILPQILETGQPGFYANWCNLLLSYLKPYYEVAIVGPDSGELSHSLLKHYQPQAIFLGGQEEGTLELLKDKLMEGETFIYVCKNKVCKLPVKTVEEAAGLMK